MYSYHKPILLMYNRNDYTNYTADQLVITEFIVRTNFHEF